jgi:hypothetical protein
MPDDLVEKSLDLGDLFDVKSTERWSVMRESGI